jgi:hypothetical protein
MARDFFTQLREFRWRGIAFPITNTRLVLRQDLALHRFVGRPGADIEGTGRAPFEISASIPFFNDIDPGPKESWTKGRLYPAVWKQFLEAMADPSTGSIQHPELGVIRAKPHMCETDWDHKTRGGVPVQAAWLETTEDPNALAALLSATSPLAGALEASKNLDALLKQTNVKIPVQSNEAKPSFQDMMRGIQGIFDQTTLLSRAISGSLANIEYRLGAVADAIDQAAKAPGQAVNDVKNWPLRDAVERMKNATRDLEKKIMAGSRPIGVYLPGRGATLGKIANDIPAPITDLMSLNPGLIATPVVPAQSLVRYYLVAALAA